MPDWWKISRPSGDTTRVDLYDGIDADDSEPDFLNGLQAIKTPKIDLHVNSDGGSITAGLAILNTLQAHPAHVTAYVDSIAASIASVIILGANKVIMAPGSLLMIHGGRAGGAGGNADQLRSVADALDKMTGVIAGIYAQKTKRPVDQIRAAMDKETWFDAEEAKAFGLCDEISGQSTIENTSRAMSAVMRLHHLPEKFRKTAERMVAQHQTENPMTPKVYQKDGKHFVDLEGKPVEVTLSPAPEITQHVAQIDTAAFKAQIDGAKAEGQKAERDYREMFDTVIATAKIEGEQLTQFTKLFYGQSKDVLSFHATNLMAGRAKPVGESGGGDLNTDPTKTGEAKEYVELKNSLTKRWDTDRDIRVLFGCKSSNPDSPEYKAQFQRYMRAELKCAADQKSPLRDRPTEGDRVGRMLSNSSLLIK